MSGLLKYSKAEGDFVVDVGLDRREEVPTIRRVGAAGEVPPGDVAGEAPCVRAARKALPRPCCRIDAIGMKYGSRACRSLAKS